MIVCNIGFILRFTDSEVGVPDRFIVEIYMESDLGSLFGSSHCSHKGNTEVHFLVNH